MSKHPFGPIEGMLIRCYRRLPGPPHPTSIRLVPKLSQASEVVDGNKHPHEYAELWPYGEYGWSPANGNSSSHGFRNSMSSVRTDSMLRKGLGYRITFTMPEQEIRTEDLTVLFEGTFEILDLTGTKLMGSFPVRFRVLSEKVVGLKWAKHVVIVHTPSHVTVTENRAKEYKYPLFGPQGWCIDEKHLEVAIRYEFFLGRYEVGKHYGVTFNCNMNYQEYVKGTFAYIFKYEDSIDQTQKKEMRSHLLASTSCLIELFQILLRDKDAIPAHVYPTLQHAVGEFELDVKSWLDGKSPFPRKITIPFIELAQREWSASIFGYFTGEMNALFILEKPESEVRQEDLGPYKTKNFTVYGYPQLDRFFRTTDGPDKAISRKELKRARYSPGSDYAYEIFPNSDFLLCSGFGRHEYRVLDLEKEYTQRYQANYEGDLRVCPHNHQKCMQVHSNFSGVLWTNWTDKLQFELYLFDSQVPTKPQSSRFLELPNLKCCILKVVFCVSRNRKLIYIAMCMMNETRISSWGTQAEGQVHLFICEQQIGSDSELSLKSHSSFNLLATRFGRHFEIKNPTLVHGRRDTVFAHVSNDFSHLWVFYCWKGKFVFTAGCSQQKPIDLTQRKFSPHLLNYWIDGKEYVRSLTFKFRF